MSRIGAEVYTILRRRITLGEYLPGTQIKEGGLAQEMQVSRTPVRAALRRLQDDGLIQISPNRGAFVTEWTDHDIDEVFDLRVTLESRAASLAARRRQPAHLQKMDRLNARMAELVTGQPEDFLVDIKQVNRAFHETVLEAAASPRMYDIVVKLLDVQRVIGAFYFYTDDELQRSVMQHRDITRAIELQDERMAEDMMRVHIGSTMDRLRRTRREVDGEAGETPAVSGPSRSSS